MILRFIKFYLADYFDIKTYMKLLSSGNDYPFKVTIENKAFLESNHYWEFARSITDCILLGNIYLFSIDFNVIFMLIMFHSFELLYHIQNNV